MPPDVGAYFYNTTKIVDSFKVNLYTFSYVLLLLTNLQQRYITHHLNVRLFVVHFARRQIRLPFYST